MYHDRIFILIGAVFAALSLFFILYLLISRKKSRLYKDILDKETQAFEALSATFGNTGSGFSVHLGDISMPEEEVTVLKEGSENLQDEDFTQITGQVPLKQFKDFDPDVLKGQYDLLGEIEGGGMSRVFLAKKTSIGNDWIVKYVPASIGELTNEADILKSLNHINLPSIIDIFNDETGLYIVQSYIEGMGMNRVLKANASIHEFVVLDWAQQLAQVLSFLHKQTILHLDLKPSNIIVTHDNKLVLIDFGISRWQTDAADSLGATVSYAAPEQLKKIGGKAKEIVAKRFGDTLPEARMDWQLDERTDIYSFGIIMFEAAVGHIPTVDTMYRLKNHLSPSFCEIIYKCLSVDPAERYQSIEELLTAVNKQQTNAKPNMLKTLIARKAAKFASAASMALAVLGLGFGFRTMQMEVQASMYVNPAVIMVSLQQSSEINITRLLPNNATPQVMDAANLRWDFTADHIAQVDGNRVIGLNIGETVIQGYYRNAAIAMQVNVVEPMDGMVDISLRYRQGFMVNLFAGTAYRDWVDGAIDATEFVSPQSMAAADNGAVYIADSGRLRRIYGGYSETIALTPSFLRPHIVRAYGNDVYILTSPWQDDYGYFFGIIRITEHGGEGFYIANAHNMGIRDFYVYNGLIYYIERNEGMGSTHLRTINTQDASDTRTIIELPTGISAIAIGGGRIYLADSEQGIIKFYENGELIHFAGASGENAFIDGSAPLFYRPTRINYNNGNLYIWDFNILRRIEIENGIARETTTIAGMASPVYYLDSLKNEPSERIILPFSYLTDFVHQDGGILISDSKRGVLWFAEYAHELYELQPILNS